MKNNSHAYDIIGDLHGYADPLRALLDQLGYVEHEGAYRHPQRRVIFLGDFIDRGPKIRETLQIVKAMVDAGTALAVLGNHEINALWFHTADGRGGHLRSHTASGGKNVIQHRATLDQIADPLPDEWAEWLSWFQTLPLFLDLGDLRIVHACWDAEQILFLKGHNRLSDALLRKSAKRGTPEYRALEVLLKGPEIKLPDGHTFTDKGGLARRHIRVKWWLGGAGHTFHSLCMPQSDTVPKLAVPATTTLTGYAATEPPVFIGHYWLPPAQPALIAPNVACVDYSVAKEGGMLTAYRWDGEQVHNADKMVFVIAESAVEGSGLKGSEERPSPGTVVFNHGKESGPWGSKIKQLAEVARRRGFAVESIDYQDLPDADARVERLLNSNIDRTGPLILVGSSMGGYVATVASAALKPAGLFLMAPAFYMPGYAEQDPTLHARTVTVIHGWKDNVIPPAHSIRFAEKFSAATSLELHIIEDDHRLSIEAALVVTTFERFLDRAHLQKGR